eukprot:TRINITY_DN6972_c0_g2_i1.p1 TRINITY_DN6972_c0_g2~~TRINITY_DN6972_c0_g2_i1.p1  ORF type:complete len:121 (-),score=12.39 TRINITY_DN6972_c0_g2_i1:304-666(-)
MCIRDSHYSVRRTPQQGIQPHADNSQWDAESGHWVGNKSPHRRWSSSTALSSQFTGGEFRFHRPYPEVLVVSQGQTLVFDASAMNLHSVAPVTSGKRDVLLVWTRGLDSRVDTSRGMSQL